MTKSFQLTVYGLPFTVRELFAIVYGQSTVNGKRLIANGSEGASHV